MLRNTSGGFGLVAILFHWISAVIAIGLFVSGLWMTGLSYSDPWYHRAPDQHRAFGVTLAALLLLRLVWRLLNPPPAPEPGVRRWERMAAGITHWAMYLLLFAIIVAGYVLSTADGRSVDVFGLFSVPPLVGNIRHLEDPAAELHYWLAMLLAALVVVHALAALKHHFLDRDRTLARMFVPARRGRY